MGRRESRRDTCSGAKLTPLTQVSAGSVADEILDGGESVRRDFMRAADLRSARAAGRSAEDDGSDYRPGL